ncbi:uncharacterized protein EI90DRAFT_3080848 [Cantharellus anzutake]|uniref:uncharacterized protein n=1 Tax=Cantharellus anzutake TaxID=1750568 RepID=UPI0019040EEE|nr:uncharacterized protein EI90DRAFT_3080848 [Cantharellus anzutake]KAF8320188.1 hypothetical protein EI90DRAFT_3080848 [Cantharellus anzutake]
MPLFLLSGAALPFEADAFRFDSISCSPFSGGICQTRRRKGPLHALSFSNVQAYVHPSHRLTVCGGGVRFEPMWLFSLQALDGSPALLTSFPTESGSGPLHTTLISCPKHRL